MTIQQGEPCLPSPPSIPGKLPSTITYTDGSRISKAITYIASKHLKQLSGYHMLSAKNYTGITRNNKTMVYTVNVENI